MRPAAILLLALASVAGCVGWRSEASDLFTDRWAMRSGPRAFDVDDAFPALTPSALAETSRDLAAIREVSYRIDLENRPSAQIKDPTLAAAILKLTPKKAEVHHP